MLTFYRPGEAKSFAAWYLREVSRALKELDRIYSELGMGARALRVWIRKVGSLGLRAAEYTVSLSSELAKRSPKQ